MSTLRDLEREVARLRDDMERQRPYNLAIEKIVEALIRFAVTGDRQEFRRTLLRWGKWLRDRR